jgi:hypothetical protein
MVYLDADIDSNLKYLELIDIYRDQWNRLWRESAGGVVDNSGRAKLMEEVVLREEESGFKPSARYSESPWTQLGRLIDKHSLSGDEIRAFLKWRAQDANARVAQAGGKKSKTSKRSKASDFFTEVRKASSSRDTLLDRVRGLSVEKPVAIEKDDGWIAELATELAKDKKKASRIKK